MLCLALFAVAQGAAQISLLFRNLDGGNNMGVYYKPEAGADKLQKVVEPNDRYRLMGFEGHNFVIRNADLKFRLAVNVFENEAYSADDEGGGHMYKIGFENLSADDEGAPMEVHSNGFIWIEAGQSHQFYSNLDHEFILRNHDNEQKVAVTILKVDDVEL